MCLNIGANQTLAIVGNSGAGKSTIFSLLLKYYAPTDGDILINGKSLSTCSLHHWRNQIAYISQDAPLLSGTIRDNLVFGMSDVPDELFIRDIVRHAYLDEFIEGLPNGLETQVGENGTMLSGGERQRVAIARAMLQQKPILLCDEASSNLDVITEHKIQLSMTKLMENKTILIAAHRLSTVVGADNIIVLKDGKIAGEGKHEELLSAMGYYQELVSYQLRT